MWEHYRKRFWGMQVVIAAFAVGFYLISHRLLFPAALFFATMQVGLVAGCGVGHSAETEVSSAWVVISLNSNNRRGKRMFKVDRIHRQRRWLAAVALGATLLLLGASAPALADEPVPDKIGALPDDADAASVPGYTKPDPDKATPKDLAAAVDAVAQSASRELLLDQLRLGAGRRLPGHLHAGGLRAGRDRPDPRQERLAHDVDELRGLRARHVRLLRLRVRAHVRRLQRHRHRRPGHARRPADAELTCSPSAASVNGDHGWGLFGTTGFCLTGSGYDARGHRHVPVHDGLHGHHRHHRHRRLRRALELQELLHLQHLHRRLHLPDLRLLGVGRRLARAARLPLRASATARSTTPAPASCTCRAARWRSSPRT